MLSYLLAAGMNTTYDALMREADIDDFDGSDPKSRWVGLLEKKWTSVIRLQKKVRRSAHTAADKTDHGPRVAQCSAHRRAGLTNTRNDLVL
jgi:hypothetical protein